MLEQKPQEPEKRKTVYKTEVPPYFKNQDGTVQEYEFTHTQEFPSGLIVKNKAINKILFVKQMSSRNKDLVETFSGGTHPLSELEIASDEEILEFLSKNGEDVKKSKKLLEDQKRLQEKIIN